MSSARNAQTVVSHSVTLNHRTWANVYLNDLPVYRTPFVGPDSRSGPVNQYLLPGENEVTVELLARAAPDDKSVKHALIFTLFVVNNLDAGPDETLDCTQLLDIRDPTIIDEAPERFRRFPFFHRQRFTLEVPVARPLFADAPPAEFDCRGTPDLRDAVERIYRAMENDAREAFLGEFALKFQCDEHAYRGEEAQRADVKREMLRSELLHYQPRPTSELDWSMIHFEPRFGGRVAYVTRHDHGYLLDAVCVKDPKRRIRADLMFIQHQGQWRAFV
jgi:hypothetical protein